MLKRFGENPDLYEIVREHEFEIMLSEIVGSNGINDWLLDAIIDLAVLSNRGKHMPATNNYIILLTESYTELKVPALRIVYRIEHAAGKIYLLTVELA